MADNLNEGLTAQVAEANEDTGAAENGVSLGKFKSVGSLLNAYSSLEAEFTRRSQRLKEVEGILGEKAAETPGQDAENSAQASPGLADAVTDEKNKDEDSADGLDKATLADGFEKEAESFLNRYPEASKFSKQLSEIAVKNNDFSEGFLQRAYVELLQDRLTHKEQLMTDENHLIRLINDTPTLKDAVIKEYLSSLRGKDSVRLMSSSGKAVTAPPLKPRSIEEAGAMAIEILSKNNKY